MCIWCKWVKEAIKSALWRNIFFLFFSEMCYLLKTYCVVVFSYNIVEIIYSFTECAKTVHRNDIYTIYINDFMYEVVLIAVHMKIQEPIFLNKFKSCISPFLDPMQFAHQSGRSCEDAILILLDKMYSHFESARFGNSVRLLCFFYFSSAFNTIQPHLLIKWWKWKFLSIDNELFVRKIPIC